MLLAGTGSAAEPPTREDCLACHGDRDLRRDKPPPGRAASLFVDAEALGASAHGALPCVACHRTATAPHDERLPPVRCAECHGAAREALGEGIHGGRAAPGRPAAAVACTACHGTHTVRPAAKMSIDACAACHRRQVEVYAQSVHGRSRERGNTEAATCRSCHGSGHRLLARSDPAASTYHLNLPRTCAQCHGDPELAQRNRIPIANVYQLYMDSIHGRAVSRSGLLVAANCSDCHGTHEIQPRSDPTSRVARAHVPRTCGACHAGIEKQYVQSVHGKDRGAAGRAAVCTDCHSAHQIRRVESPWQRDVIRECGTCHQESLKTYRDTFHGKVTALGFGRVAKCADCHGSHSIRPASDPDSQVSGSRIVSTCRQCHPQANWQFAQFRPHADPENPERFPLLYYSYLLMSALLVGTFGFFGLHTILWLPRSFRDRLRGDGPPGEGRPPG